LKQNYNHDYHIQPTTAKFHTHGNETLEAVY